MGATLGQKARPKQFLLESVGTRLRLVVQNHVQQRAVNFQAAAIA
jgi:hypothetical protein